MVGVRQFDEAEALRKALTLFWTKGFDETSMQELASATGVQRGSLYNAYGDKGALFLKVFEVYRRDFLRQLRASLDRPKLHDALQSFFDCVVTSMTTGNPTRGCLSTKTAASTAIVDESIREAVQGLLDELEGLLGGRLARAQPSDGLRLAPGEAARLIVTLTRGIVIIERVYQDEQRLRATADALIALLLDDRALASGGDRA
ncbi:TetR/AcrR family transcriptional regulator [Chelatococcus reniformis]|uniref:TetR family transcriptional regulator n=1 Tax=Chelatococcus reniformis TaxID=1494448 RepID=A0A916U7E0_9HYPH|nr:TetR/AcrR family transcriptional regulator [Chelatococcus reniformis]GGC61911.1 TetR family transcriptional regulator [Chelatococcus reniformis]